MGTISTVAIDLRAIAGPLQIPLARIERVVELLDAGNTVPFITRYRKDETGGLDEEQIRQIQQRLGKLRLLGERKQTILRSIESQGKLTEALAAEIEAAESTKRLEDLYLPFKPKKQTLATLARERGLEPLAEEVLSASPAAANLDARAADFVASERGIASPADALLGVGHILAEIFSERADLRQRLRKIIQRSGKLTSARAEPDDKKSQGFRDYFAYSEQLSQVPPHRILAINRGERAKVLRIKIEVDTAAMEQVADELLVPPDHPHADLLRGCARDALARLVFPSLEREARRELTDRAEAHAVHVFARNLRNLLLQPPVRSRRVLAVDPGFKSGCKLAALDEFGNLLAHAVIHLVGKAERRVEAKAKIVELIATHDLSLVAIGNGTACRESEELIGELLAAELADKSVAYVIVNEAGASVYSASPLGREEFPEYDATLRGAIFDRPPLAGSAERAGEDRSGQHRRGHVSARREGQALAGVAGRRCRVVREFRRRRSEHGQPGAAALRLGLESTDRPAGVRLPRRAWPFPLARAIEGGAGFRRGGLRAGGRLFEDRRTRQSAGRHLDPSGKLSPGGASARDDRGQRVGPGRQRIGVARGRAGGANPGRGGGSPVRRRHAAVGRHSAQLARPGRDPREDLPPPIFKKGVIKLDDLSPGMELSGTVLNVVDFGAFVDIGLHDTGLVHISQLANKYVRDPHEVVSVGDTVHVWVHEIDKTRRRVSLTMIPPGTPRGNERRGRPKRGERPAQQGAAAGAPGEAGAEGASPGNGAAASIGEAAPAGREQRGPRRDRPAGRPPRRDQASGRPGGARHGGQSDRPPRPKFKSGPPKKPKPLIPITPEMKAGRAPLRTFGDLKQFIEFKTSADTTQADETAAPAASALRDEAASDQRLRKHHRPRPPPPIRRRAEPASRAVARRAPGDAFDSST